MDQTVAWIFSFVLALSLFGLLYMVTDFFGKKYNASKRRPHEMAEEADHDSGSSHDSDHDDLDKLDKKTGEKSQEEKDAAEHAGFADWGYRGSIGASHWGTLADAYKLCEDGRKQSPIDIEKVKTSSKLLPLKFVYQDTEISMHNNGHTIQGNYGSGSHIEISGDIYNMLQFHLHSLVNIEKPAFNMMLNYTSP